VVVVLKRIKVMMKQRFSSQKCVSKNDEIKSGSALSKICFIKYPPTVFQVARATALSNHKKQVVL